MPKFRPLPTDEHWTLARELLRAHKREHPEAIERLDHWITSLLKNQERIKAATKQVHRRMKRRDAELEDV